MWYFTWVLGLGFACAFGIINALWIEFRESGRGRREKPLAITPPPSDSQPNMMSEEI